MRWRFSLLTVLLGLAATALAGAQTAPVPAGEVFDLRAAPDDCGFAGPDLAFSRDGSLLVVWLDATRGLVARSFGPDGSGPGDLLVLGTPTFAWHGTPQVAGLGDERFAVAWLEGPAFGYDRTLVLQVFDRHGIPRSELFTAASHVLDFDLGADGNDRILLAWTEEVDSERALKLQPFEPTGPAAPPVVIEAVSTVVIDGGYETVYWPRVALSSRGSGLVVWVHAWPQQTDRGDPPENRLHSAEVSVDAASIGPTLDVSPTQATWKHLFRPQPISSNRFLTTWLSPGLIVESDLFARTWSTFFGLSPLAHYEPSDVPILMQIVGGPKIGATWIEIAVENRDSHLAARPAGPLGQPSGTAVPISRPLCEANDLETGCGLYYSTVSAAARGDGRIAVVWLVGRWSGIIPTECDEGLTVRMRFLDTPVLFDDFETGDLTRWSSRQEDH